LANTYKFERRAIYWEEEIVYADTVEEAWEKIGNGDADELNIQDFYDYYDDEYELVDEKIDDPLVDMVINYDKYRQMELFE
jgi:DNA-binding protein Fis